MSSKTIPAAMLFLLLCSSLTIAQHADTRSALASELAADVARVSENWIPLFEAMPEDKLDWRPQEGVRSVRELFTHIADANYFFLTFGGYPMPQDPNMPRDRTKRENRYTSKADILEHLRASFSNAQEKIGQISDSTLASTVTMFGNQVTARAAMLVNLGHMHEHMGQAIAYARVNGVTPPWSQTN